jgi:hypothetical protein
MVEEIAKPRELLAARTSTAVLFRLLREWFDVPDEVTLDLRGIDSAVEQLDDTQHVMAMAMRKLQALHLLTIPGLPTTTDVVLTVIQDLERSLVQAPRTYLRSQAEGTDWDAELAALDDEPPGGGAGDAGSEAFDDIERFRRHHAALHAAAKAVLHASDGRICILL